MSKIRLAALTALTAVIDPRPYGMPTFMPRLVQPTVDPNAPSRSQVLGRDRELKREQKKVRNARRRKRGW